MDTMQLDIQLLHNYIVRSQIYIQYYWYLYNTVIYLCGIQGYTFSSHGKIDETISKLQIFKYNVQTDVTRMKDIERNSENKEYSENFYEMVDKFMKMTETLEHIAKNKFRPVVEKELKEFIKNIVEEVLLEKQGKIYGMFDV